MTNKNNTERAKIAIIGGGFSGICTAIQIDKQFGPNGPAYTIFDENEDFGGTWYRNKYPGIACDIPSHLYSLSFELNPNWSQNHAAGPEILEYVLNIARKYNLYEKTRFLTSVKSLEWLENKSQWKVHVLNQKTGKIEQLYFNYVVTACGTLRAPFIPSQFSSFKGTVMHSAEWNSSVDLVGKRVGVVGSGASAIQIVPAVSKNVKELHCYQRRPAWIMPRSQFDIPPLIQQLFIVIPLFLWLFRWYIYLFSEIRYDAFQDGSFANSIGTGIAKKHIVKQLNGDKNLVEKLTPKYKLGCKRVIVSSDYFPVFTRPNVHLHCGEIQKVDEKTISSADGTTQELDVLILATGFRVHDFFAPLQITGKSGVDILSDWKLNSPKTFYGIMTSLGPNLFILRGPNSALAHNSALFMMECQVNFTLDVIRQTEKKGAKSVVVKKKAEDDWMEDLAKNIKTGIWNTESCGGWYKDSKGVVTTLWPKRSVTYWWETRTVNPKNLQFTY